MCWEHTSSPRLHSGSILTADSSSRPVQTVLFASSPSRKSLTENVSHPLFLISNQLIVCRTYHVEPHPHRHPRRGLGTTIHDGVPRSYGAHRRFSQVMISFLNFFSLGAAVSGLEKMVKRVSPLYFVSCVSCTFFVFGYVTANRPISHYSLRLYRSSL
jgi:hypothetical protein